MQTFIGNLKMLVHLVVGMGIKCKHSIASLTFITFIPVRTSYWKIRRKEGNIVFNNALNTFYLQLYVVGHMVKKHSDCERENTLPPHGIFLPISS